MENEHFGLPGELMLRIVAFLPPQTAVGKTALLALAATNRHFRDNIEAICDYFLNQMQLRAVRDPSWRSSRLVLQHANEALRTHVHKPAWCRVGFFSEFPPTKNGRKGER